MKKGLLGSTALVAATALTAGIAQAQAPTVSFSGFMNFQAYFPDTDVTTITPVTVTFLGTTVALYAHKLQDATVQFGTDDAELHVNVSGTADNGLEYGAKIELEATQGSTGNADEARIQLRGSWGTLQLGDDDGAEDTMNYGGENVLGAAGGWDGDGDDMTTLASAFFPNIAGDSSDASKITYYSPRFSGVQIGVSYTPDLSQQGDQNPKDDGLFQDHIGVGVNYDGTFGDVRVRASGVYSTASFAPNLVAALPGGTIEDISAYSLGAIVGFGPFQLGANYTDNGESGTITGLNASHSYWDVAAGFETGPVYLSLGYISHEYEALGAKVEPSAISVTADYTVAPGLTAYAEYTAYDADVTPSADASVIILGMNLGF